MGKVGETLKKYDIRPVKSLGQNFLTNERIVEKILEAADIVPGDLIVEIGPGTGSLTTKIITRTEKLLAIEIDSRLVPLLNEQLQDHKDAVVINGDFLKINLEEEISRLFGNLGKYKVIANLPYYITTPIIMKLLEQESNMELMVIMVQKEVADRILAQPGTKDYGALSVAVRYYSRPEKVMDVSPDCFIPQPGVYSSVIKLERCTDLPFDILNKDIFFKTVKAAFGQRRKKISNALFNSGFFNLQKEEISEILNSSNIKPDIRGEMLNIEQFAQLSNALAKKDC